MKHLGTIEGIGRLIANSEDVCAVSYSIRVYDKGQFKHRIANGTLEMDMSELLETWNAMAVFAIKLDDGNEVSINITKLTNRGATFKVSGPVPGF